MKTKAVIEYFGSVKKVGHALDIYPQAIYQWGENVPDKMSYKIQVLTDGDLKVGKIDAK